MREQVNPMLFIRSSELIREGVIDLRQKDLDGAEAAFQTALEVQPQAAAFDGLGCVAFVRGDTVVAREFFLKAISVDHRYSEARLNLAILLEKEGDMYGANEMYRQSLELDPSNLRARVNYAAFMMKTPATREEGRFLLRQAKALAQSREGVVRLTNLVGRVEHGKDETKTGING